MALLGQVKYPTLYPLVLALTVTCRQCLWEVSPIPFLIFWCSSSSSLLPTVFWLLRTIFLFSRLVKIVLRPLSTALGQGTLVGQTLH